MMARSLLWSSKKTSGTVRVYYLHADSTPAWVSGVVSSIETAASTYGLGVTFSFVTDFQGSNLNSLTLTNYDACLVANNSSLSSGAGPQLQLFALQGGGIAICTFANASIPISGLNYAIYTPIQNTPGNQFLASSMNVSSIVSHPVTIGLSSVTFNTGGGGFAGQGTQLSAGAISVVNYAEGTTLLAVKEVPL